MDNDARQANHCTYWSVSAGHAYLQTTFSFVVTYEVQNDILALLYVIGKISPKAVEAPEKPRG